MVEKALDARPVAKAPTTATGETANSSRRPKRADSPSSGLLARVSATGNSATENRIEASRNSSYRAGSARLISNGPLPAPSVRAIT